MYDAIPRRMHFLLGVFHCLDVVLCRIDFVSMQRLAVMTGFRVAVQYLWLSCINKETKEKKNVTDFS